MDFMTRNSGLGWAFGALLAFGVFGAAHAQASPIEVSSVAYQEVEVVAADGTRSIKLEPAARIAPGGVVVYEITYHNEAAQPATDVAINNPVARELVYLDASVAPSARRTATSFPRSRARASRTLARFVHARSSTSPTTPTSSSAAARSSGSAPG